MHRMIESVGKSCSNASMRPRETLGIFATLVFLLAGCVLIDSCLEDCTYVDIDGDGPDAPLPSFEIASKNPGIQLEIQAVPVLPDFLTSLIEVVERPSSAEEASVPTALEPVDPSSWLGRRHFRSPT
jgi:hypothetical protein